MFTDDYNDYMQSEQWKNLRRIRIQIDGGKCAMCGKKTDDIEVHHMRYDSLRHENPWRDLVSLCRSCHESVHALMNRPTGQREDGSLIYGWSDVLPRHIRKALEKRGLM